MISGGRPFVTPALREETPELDEWPRVDDLAGFEPAALRDRDAVSHVVEMRDRVSIRIDRKQHTLVARAAYELVVEIETIGKGVDLEGARPRADRPYLV